MEEAANLAVIRENRDSLIFLQNAVVGDITCHEHHFWICQLAYSLVKGVAFEIFGQHKQRFFHEGERLLFKLAVIVDHLWHACRIDNRADIVGRWP